MSEAELLEKVAESDAIIVRSGTQVTKEVFAASKGRLRVVGRAALELTTSTCTPPPRTAALW